jgi:hypothetical protein
MSKKLLTIVFLAITTIYSTTSFAFYTQIKSYDDETSRLAWTSKYNRFHLYSNTIPTIEEPVCASSSFSFKIKKSSIISRAFCVGSKYFCSYTFCGDQRKLKKISIALVLRYRGDSVSTKRVIFSDKHGRIVESNIHDFYIECEGNFSFALLELEIKSVDAIGVIVFDQGKFPLKSSIELCISKCKLNFSTFDAKDAAWQQIKDGIFFSGVEATGFF